MSEKQKESFMSDKQKPETEKHIVTRPIEFKLIESEYAEKGREAAVKARELGSLNAEFDNIKKNFKSRIELKSGEMNIILRTIEDGKEIRDVECVEDKDYDRHIVSYVYRGEIVEERPMELHERQPELVGVKTAKEKSDIRKHLEREAKLDGENKYPEGESSEHSISDIRAAMNSEKSARTKKDLTT